ncbi:MAG: penicillin-binding protein activator, partial [Methylococcales bacterium]
MRTAPGTVTQNLLFDMNRSITTFFPSLLVIALICGCGVAVRPTDLSSYQEDIDLARRLSQDGDHPGAARIYRKLAKKTAPPWSDVFRFEAAESLFQAGEIESARKLAARTKPANLSLTDRYRLRLLYGRIFLAKKQPQQTLVQLESLPAGNIRPDLRLDYHLQRAKAFSMLDQHFESAREQVETEALLSDPKDIQASQIAIIDELAFLSNVDSMEIESKHSGRIKSWLELTRILKQMRPGTQVFDQRIEEWKQKFPDHSANIPVLLAKVSLERGPFTMPEAIAVLLPLSGPYAPSGEAVRQGILVARKYNQANQVTTRFYDSEHADIAKLYRRVVAEGADIVIGPLEKPLLKSLATRVRLSVPVLGLNQVPELNVPMLYQFALNPEDEVDQAANSAWFDGYHRALILAPANTHGRRLADDFSRKWQQLGGEIARSESYNPKNNRYNEVIRRLLDT